MKVYSVTFNHKLAKQGLAGFTVQAPNLDAARALIVRHQGDYLRSAYVWAPGGKVHRVKLDGER